MKQDLWDFEQQDKKAINRVTTFIIFCEDGYHEPAYFRSFEIEDKLKINAIERQGQSLSNFFNVVKYCRDYGLMETVNGTDKLKEGVTEHIWSVYDRDENSKQPNRKEREDNEFDIAIEQATNAGLHVAWSNDSFELWVLLHFDALNADAKISRDDIYTRLTQLVQQLPDPQNALSSIIATNNFYYKKHLKPHFANVVMPLLKERSGIALENAIALEKLYPHTISYHDRNPCTMVHHLVKELLAFHHD